MARRGADTAILPAQTGWWSEGSGWRKAARTGTLRFLVFDDRRMYRPGEEVRVKGWLRRIGAGPRGDVEALPPSVTAVAWTLRDSRGNEVGKGDARVGGLGGFDLALRLPATMNLGAATLQLEAGGTALEGRRHDHVFEVQEFRRPEFEVKAVASEGPHLVGGAATVAVSAAYYAGAPCRARRSSGGSRRRRATSARRTATTTSSARSSPGGSRGRARPSRSAWRRCRPARTARAFTACGSTSIRGDPPRPRVVHAEATVVDVNRQAWTAGAFLLVHPSERYVGLRAERAFVQKGEPIALDVIATDLEGRAIAGRPVRLRAERLDWEQVEGEWKEVPKDAQERMLDSGAEPARVHFEAKEGGPWRVVARVADERNRENETELRIWVAGGRVPPRRDLEEEKVTLVPDRKEYRAGDVAKVLVLAPFAPAEGVLTLRRSGLVREERFTIAGGSHTLEIPVLEGFTPNVHVQVDLVGGAPREETRAKTSQRRLPPRGRPSRAAASTSPSRPSREPSPSRSRRGRRRSPPGARPSST